MRQHKFSYFSLNRQAGMSLIEILISLFLASLIIFAASKMLTNSAKMAQNAEFNMTEENAILHAAHRLARELENAHVMQARTNYYYSDAGAHQYSMQGGLNCGGGSGGSANSMLTGRSEKAESKEIKLLKEGDTFGFIYSAASEISSFYKIPGKENEFDTKQLVVSDPHNYKAGNLILISTRNANYQTAFFAEVTGIDASKRTIKIDYDNSYNLRNLMWDQGPCTYSLPENLESGFIKNYANQEDVLRVDLIHQVKYYLEGKKRYADTHRPFYDLYRESWKSKNEYAVNMVAEKIIGEGDNSGEYSSELGVSLNQTWTPTDESALWLVKSAQEASGSAGSSDLRQQTENSQLGTTTNEFRVVYAGAMGDGEARGQVITSQSSYSFTSSGRANFDLVLEGEVYNATSPGLALRFKEYFEGDAGKGEDKSGQEKLSCGDGINYFQLFTVMLHVDKYHNEQFSDLTNKYRHLEFIDFNTEYEDVDIKCVQPKEEYETNQFYPWDYIERNNTKTDYAPFRDKNPTLVCCARFKSHAVKYCRSGEKNLPDSERKGEPIDGDIIPVRFRGSFSASVTGGGTGLRKKTIVDGKELRGLLWQTPVTTFYLTNPFLGEKFCKNVTATELQDSLKRDKKNLIRAFARGCKKGCYKDETCIDGISPPQYTLTDAIIGSRSRPVKTLVTGATWRCEGKVKFPEFVVPGECDSAGPYSSEWIYLGCKTMENKIFDHFVNAWKEDPDHPDDKKYKQINKCWLDNVVYYPNEIARTIMQSCIDDDGNRHLITEPVVIRYDELHDNDRANPDADDPTNYDNAVKSDCRYFKGLVDDKSYDNVKYGYPGLDNVCQQ